MLPNWEAVATAQSGMIARRQLLAFGVDWARVRNHLAARRWAERSSSVISTFTGPLTPVHLMWLGVLHAGGDSLVGGLTAATAHGLTRWERAEVTVLVDDERLFDPLPAVRFVRTRRSLKEMRDESSDLPLCRIEPALLLCAAYELSERAAQGVLMAAVQQRLTTPELLAAWVDRMRPLRRAALFRQLVTEISGGAQSFGEARFGRLCQQFGLRPPTRQVARRDGRGRLRFTDCEWTLSEGRVLVLEIDGGFHMDVDRWEDDIVRQRGLAGPGRLVVRCTTRELREDPTPVFGDLRRLGVPRAES
ncbi:MAG TPA: hypothetical protein VFM01_19630 [Nakamurella sp.]|nr:hypothetical protein [Nakamurella sp.]